MIVGWNHLLDYLLLPPAKDSSGVFRKKKTRISVKCKYELKNRNLVNMNEISVSKSGTQICRS